MTDVTDQTINPSDWDDQIICRRKLDEERRNEWICQCPVCKLKKENGQKKT